VGVFAATLFSFVALGAVLPVLPRYIVGPLDGGDVEVGLVAGIFAATAIISRPIGGRLADERGRRLVMLVGLAFVSVSGALIFLPFGIGGLVLSRLVLGWGVGWVFTAGLAWAVDLAPEDRRGQIIGYYGLGVWGGLAVGPLVGEGIYALAGYDAVWAFAALSPLVGAVLAWITPDRREVTVTPASSVRESVLPRPAVRPGVALFMASFGYATLAGFLILHLEEQGTGGGAAVLTAFASR
jgi:MFS family permease